MPNGYPGHDPQAAEQAREAAAKAEQERKATAEQEVDARLAARDRTVAEFYENEAGITPTPTQRENDLAKVGALDIDEKEDDGSGPEDEFHARVLHARVPGGHPYLTRRIDSGEPAPKRGPGRPRKSEQPTSE